MQRRILQLSVLLLNIQLFGCATISPEDKQLRLEQTLRTYAAAMRWGMYEEAAKYHVTKAGLAMDIDIQPLKNIKISEYQLANFHMAKDEKTAEMQIVLNYYHQDIGKLRNAKIVQFWWFDEKNKLWLTDSPFPKLKD